MQFKATCTAQASGFEGGMIKALLSVTSFPNSPTEHLLVNLLKSRGTLELGKTYRITIEEDETP
jgi:hypothetical protein